MRVQGLGSLLTLALAVACGRTDDDVSKGNGGAPSFGGEGPRGGSAGAGSSGRGGAPGSGGALASGGSGIAGGGRAQGGAPSFGGEAGAGGGEGVFVESSWDTTVSLKVIGSNSSLPVAFVCNRATLTMHLTPNDAGLGLIWGGSGDVLTGELARLRSGGPHFDGGGELTLPTRGGDCEASSATTEKIALDGQDLDGDGVVDHAVGVGTATAHVLQGDVVYNVRLSFTLDAFPDRTSPTLVVPASAHPLDGLSVRASEPLALSTALALESSLAPVQVALMPSGNAEGAVGWFSTATILPFGSSWKVRGKGADLAGLALDLTGASELQVLPDPGLFAEDGFESQPNVATVGEVKTVTAIGNLPAISGTRSLLVPPNASATLRLSRPSGSKVVRLTLQRLTPINQSLGGPAPVQAGVIGGTVRVTPSPPPPASTPTATGDATWAYAASKEEVSLALSENGVGVVVRIAPPTCYGLCPPAQAVLVDDLRVE